MLRKIVKFLLLSLILLSMLAVLLLAILPYWKLSQDPHTDPGALLSYIVVMILSFPVIVSEIELSFNVLYFWSTKEVRSAWKSVIHIMAALAALGLWVCMIVQPTSYIPAFQWIGGILAVLHLSYGIALLLSKKKTNHNYKIR